MSRTLRILALAMLLIGVAAVAAADSHEEPSVYVWINYVKAQPGQGDALVGLLMEDAAVFDPLVESGAALDWGIAMPVVHSGGDTGLRIEWISLVGWEGADQFMKAFGARMESMTPEQRQSMAEKWETIVEPGSHMDVVNRSAHIGSGDPTGLSYLHLTYWTAKPGKGRQAMDFYEEYAAPVYDQLVADGKILNYGLHVPDLHRGEDWTHLDWYAASNLAARDAVNSAFDAVDSARSEEENKAWMSRVMDIFEWEHEDQILLVVHHNFGSGGGD